MASEDAAPPDGGEAEQAGSQTGPASLSAGASDALADPPRPGPDADPDADVATAPSVAATRTAPAPLVRRTARALVACAALIVVLLAADLATKRWAEGRLSTARLGDAPAVCAPGEHGGWRTQRIRRPPLVMVEDVFELEYTENCGAAFGLLRDAPALLRSAVFDTAAIAASLALLFFFATGRGGPFFAWSVPFVVAGAVGNLVDRVANGYVVDFIHFHYGTSFDYPTFNVADIAITIGVVCLVIDGFRQPAEAPDTTAADGDAART